MTALATSSGGSRATAPSSIDHAIRLSTAAAVLAVAGVAAYVSYWPAYAVVRVYGGSGLTARLEPATIDGLVYASSMIILYAARHRIPVPALARWLLGLGIAAALSANMAQGWAHGPVGAVVAAWPAVSLVGSYELLVWLIRTAGTVEREPPAEQCCEGTAWCAAARSAPAAAIDSGQDSQNDRDLSTQGWQSTGQPAGRPTTAASAQHGGVPGADAGNDAAVAAYRLSVKAGNPLSERKLAQMFGRTSRRWARARIADARQSAKDPIKVCSRGRLRPMTVAIQGPIVGPQPTCYRPAAAGALRTWAASGVITCSASRYTPRRVLEENDRWNSRPR